MTRDRILVVVRWVVTTVLVALLAVAMIRLSEWQWSKHTIRNEQISRVQANRRGGVVHLTDVVRGTDTVDEQKRWRSVQVTGSYDPARTIVVRLRSVGDQSGFEVVTPLRTSDGTTVLVDRGLLARPDAAARPAAVPEPPARPVTVIGYLRSPETGGTAPVGGIVRAIDVAAITPTLPYPVVDGYLALTVSDPADDASFTHLQPPSDDPGPYLSYSVQWVIFAVIAVGGLLFLAFDEVRGGRIRARLRAAAPQPHPVGGGGPDGLGSDDAQEGAPSGGAAIPVVASRQATATRHVAGARPARRIGVLAGSVRDTDLPADFFDEPGEDPGDDVGEDGAAHEHPGAGHRVGTASNHIDRLR